MISITLAMPNFNHSAFLNRSISGLLNQERPADEVLILDDASTDNSVEVMREITGDAENVRLICLGQNEGVVSGMNTLLKESSSDWIAYAAADDFLYPSHLKTLEALALSAPDVAFVSACVDLVDENDNKLGDRPVFYPSVTPRVFRPNKVRRLFRKNDNQLQSQVCLFRRETLVAMGGFDEAMGSASDGVLMRELALTHGFGFIPQSLGVWRLHGGNFSLSSAFEVANFKSLIVRAKSYIAKCPNGLFPENYGSLLSRRMQFGVARLIIFGSFSSEQRAEKIIELVDAAPLERRIINHLASDGRGFKLALQMWIYLRLWPYSPFQLAIQPARKRIAQFFVALRKQ